MQIMKKTILVVGALMLAATAAWAVDYTKMSNDELSAARGQLNQASAEDWNGFHTEWWKRLSQMSPEERQKYLGPGMGRGMGQGMGQGKGMGMGRHGMGRGMGCCPCWGAPNTTPPAAK